MKHIREFLKKNGHKTFFINKTFKTTFEQVPQTHTTPKKKSSQTPTPIPNLTMTAEKVNTAAAHACTYHVYRS